MKKHFSWIVTIIVAISLMFCFVGCKDPESEVTTDTTPPAEVSTFVVSAVNENAVLNWINPTDSDFAGVQISMNPAEGILASPISLGKSVTTFTVSGLRTGTEYTFTVKTYDNSLNYSTGTSRAVSITANGSGENDDPSGGGSSGGENTQPENTDTTPPAQVTNLTAVYSAEQLQITVSWTNPQDTDFAGTVIDYGKTSSSEKTTLTFDKSYSSAVIQGIAADDSEYSISVKTKDTTGNLSEATNTTIIAKNDEIVVPEGLRTGDYVLTDKTYVRKEYFSELTQEERAKIFGIVLITDSNIPLILGTQFSTNESKWTASPIGIDTYLAEITTGISGSSSYGYTFTGDLDGSDNWEYICSVDDATAKGSQVASMYPAFYLTNIYASYADLTGTDFADGWYLPAISELYQMHKNISTIKSSLANLEITLPYTYDDTLGEYTCRGFWSSSVPTAPGQTAYKLDYYTGKIENVDRGTNSNYVWAFHKVSNEFKCYEYSDAQIANVELETSTIGETYTGTISVRITGENLLAYDITSQDSNIFNVNYVSNTEATAKLKINNSVGSHLVTINCGTASGCASYNVVESNKCFSVGDILFTDGTKMKAEDVQYGVPDEQISKAFGVIASTTYGGITGKAVGLQKSSSTLQWAPSGTTGYNRNFTEIQGTATSGDMDGSDNWAEICKVDTEGTVYPATNYPAFNFANTYGITAGLTGTDYKNGWYLPSIAELYQVYGNKTVIQEGLTAAGGFTIGTSYYWSSSQYSSGNKYAYLLNFNNGDVYYGDGKNDNNDVLVLQAFNCEQFNNYEVTTTPSITSVEIETAGEGYTGDLVVTITGNNLKGHPVTCSDASFENVKYVSDTEVTATITCTGTVVTSYITVTCGSSSSTGTVKVLSSANCFSSENIGDIVLSDGSFVTKENFNSNTMTPIAVVVGVKNNGGQAIGVGLQKSSSTLQWAPSGTTGYNTNFTEIQGTTESGDMDGSDNWEYICSIDPTGSVDAATNYPAFNFANTYGTTAGLTSTDYADGWYLPSIAELYQVYGNKTVIQEGLTAAGGFTLGTSYYWSSSQYSSSYKGAYRLSFYYGSVGSYYKSVNYDVLVLQAFNAQ